MHSQHTTALADRHTATSECKWNWLWLHFGELFVPTSSFCKCVCILTVHVRRCMLYDFKIKSLDRVWIKRRTVAGVRIWINYMTCGRSKRSHIRIEYFFLSLAVQRTNWFFMGYSYNDNSYFFAGAGCRWCCCFIVISCFSCVCIWFTHMWPASISLLLLHIFALLSSSVGILLVYHSPGVGMWCVLCGAKPCTSWLMESVFRRSLACGNVEKCNLMDNELGASFFSVVDSHRFLFSSPSFSPRYVASVTLNVRIEESSCCAHQTNTIDHYYYK